MPDRLTIPCLPGFVSTWRTKHDRLTGLRDEVVNLIVAVPLLGTGSFLENWLGRGTPLKANSNFLKIQ